MAMQVLVAGAGPAGSVAARRCAELGLDVVLAEEHPVVGEPVRCAGLVSPKAVRVCGLPTDADFVRREVRGAHVHSPSGRVVEVDGGETKALVVERDEMDRAAAELAVDAGAELRLGAEVGLEGETISLDGERVDPGVLVDATGARALAARDRGLPPEKVVPAVQATIRGAETLREDFVEVFVGNEWAPGFFAYAVPVEGGARVGLGTGTGENPRELFDEFLERHPAGERLSGEVVDWGSGPIPMGPPRETVSGDVVLVGDAAGQTKPTSGGGVYTGAVAGRCAAEAADRYLRGEGELEEYDEAWRAEVGRELRFGMRAHRALCRASDGDLERLLDLVEEAMPVVRRHGDIDRPSRLARALMRRPGTAASLAWLYLRTFLPL